MYINPQSCFQASNTSREATEEGRRLSEVIYILDTSYCTYYGITRYTKNKMKDDSSNDEFRSRSP
jgi:hypothetical protein